MYTKAVTFMFPHRKEKLEDYAEQVASLFVAVIKSNHPIIFNYDKAIQTHIGDIWNLLLTDKSEFEDLHLYWLHPLGQRFQDTSTGLTPNCNSKMNFRSNDDCISSIMENALIKHPAVNTTMGVSGRGVNTLGRAVIRGKLRSMTNVPNIPVDFCVILMIYLIMEGSVMWLARGLQLHWYLECL